MITPSISLSIIYFYIRHIILWDYNNSVSRFLNLNKRCHFGFANTSHFKLIESLITQELIQIIELAILLFIVIGVIWLISKIVTPQVVTVVSVIAGFLILRFIVRVILKVTITLLSILFWLTILCAILLCVL